MERVFCALRCFNTFLLLLRCCPVALEGSVGGFVNSVASPVTAALLVVRTAAGAAVGGLAGAGGSLGVVVLVVVVVVGALVVVGAGVGGVGVGAGAGAGDGHRTDTGTSTRTTRKKDSASFSHFTATGTEPRIPIYLALEPVGGQLLQNVPCKLVLGVLLT